MIDWITIKPALRDTVVTLMGIAPEQVRWKDEPEGSTWMNFPTVLLSVRDLVGVGVEEERRTDPVAPATDPQEVVTAGQKHFTLSVRVESDTADIADPNQAGSFGETLKTRFARATTVERLRGICSLAEYMSTKSFEYVDASGRAISCYVFDLLCATVDNDVDTSAGAGSVIESTTGAGTVDGVTVPIIAP